MRDFPAAAAAVCEDLTARAGSRESVLLFYDEPAGSFAAAAAAGPRAATWVSRALPFDDGLPLWSLLDEGSPLPSGWTWDGLEPAAAVPLAAPEPLGVLLLFDAPDQPADQLAGAAEQAIEHLTVHRPDGWHDCLFRQILELEPAGIAVVEGEDHVCTYASEAFRRLADDEHVPFLGRPLRAAVPSLAAEAADEMQLARVSRLAQHRANVDLVDALGRRSYDLHVLPQDLPGSDAPALVLVAWSRTSAMETRRALESTIVRLSESQGVFGALLDATHSGILFAGNDGAVMYANRRLGELFGIDPSTLIGERLIGSAAPRLYRHVADRAAAIERFEATAEFQRDTRTEDIEISRPVYRVLERFSGPVYRNGSELYGRIEIFTDVTTDRTLRRNKDEFLSLVSHELRTPITSIKGYAQLLKRRAGGEGLSPATVSACDVIERQAVRMQELIDRMLDLSRLETGRLVLQVSTCDLTAVVQRAVEALMSEEPRHTIEFSAPADPVLVQGDERRLEQVVCNLLDNAAHYSPPGTAITVRIWQREGSAAFSVTDCGAGIPAAALPHIFERFHRVNGLAESQGMGIGLYICKGIVEEHGGKIEVHSVQGEGSEFSVTLPSAGRIPVARHSLHAG